MKNSIQFLLILFSIGLVSCNERTTQYEEIIEDKPISNLLVGERLHCTENLNSFVDIKFFDNYLLLTDRVREYHFHLYYVSDSCRKILEFGKRGDGPEEFGMPMVISSSMKSLPGENGFLFSVYDVNSRKFSEVKFLNSSEPNAEVLSNQRFDPLLIGAFELIQLNDGRVIGKNHMAGKGNFFFFHPESRDFIWNDFYPVLEKKPIPDKEALAYDSYIDFSENHNMIVVAMRFFNRINFHKSDGELVKSVIFGNPVEPDFSVQTKFLVPETVKFYFNGIVCGNNYVYGLINSTHTKTKQESSELIVMDYNGNFINGYHLDKPLNKFAVDEKNNSVYGIYYNPEIEGVEIFKYLF